MAAARRPCDRSCMRSVLHYVIGIWGTIDLPLRPPTDGDACGTRCEDTETLCLSKWSSLA